MTEATATAVPRAETPRCPDAPASTWAVIERLQAACPWVVLPVDEHYVGVAAIETPTQIIARYELPSACVPGGCELDGVDERVTPSLTIEEGPLLVLSRSAEDSGHPAEVWVGISTASGHRFVPTWREPHVRSDFSRIGPAFHLVPHRCAEGIALLAERRLDGEGDAPSATTLAGEGYPSAFDDGEVVMSPLDTSARVECVRLDVPLP